MVLHNGPCAFIGFDSAWTDNPRAPGAVCSLVTRADGPPLFQAPQLATFAHALAFIRAIQATSRFTLIALDQPTVVNNMDSLRPVERVAASLVSWLGGGVQPSNRGRTGMFCNAAPIWPFLQSLGAIEDPETARIASDGLYLMEVFPAISMPSLSAEFFGRLAAPRYNPARKKTFKASDWSKVTVALAEKFEEFGFQEPVEWLRKVTHLPRVSKADQDQLDAMVCLWIALHWRLKLREHSLMIGCKESGYMVLPASEGPRLRLAAAAERFGVNYH